MNEDTAAIDGGHSLPPTNCLGTPGAVVVGVTPVAADSPVSVWGGGPDADPADVHGRPAPGVWWCRSCGVTASRLTDSPPRCLCGERMEVPATGGTTRRCAPLVQLGSEGWTEYAPGEKKADPPPGPDRPQRMAQNPDPARTELSRSLRRWLQAQGRIAAASLQAGEEAAKILRLTCADEGGLDISWPLIVDGTVIDRRESKLTLRQGTEL